MRTLVTEGLSQQDVTYLPCFRRNRNILPRNPSGAARQLPLHKGAFGAANDHLLQKRYRAGQGSNEYLRTGHALSAATRRPFINLSNFVYSSVIGCSKPTGILIAERLRKP